jgi:hypothetical protein
MKNIKTINTIKLLAVLFISTFAFTACSDDDDHDEDHEHEEELITTVIYTLTNNNDTVTLKFVDLDGEGGEEGTYSVTGPLSANSTYIGEIALLNESESPAEDITEEVKEESDEHEFFYSSSISGLTVSKNDTDSNGNPIGITTALTTTDSGSGTITIILKHEPTKPNNGSATDAGGSTDVSVTFTVEVE